MPNSLSQSHRAGASNRWAIASTRPISVRLTNRATPPWLKKGKVTPVIDRRYTLEQVPDAVAYVEEGHARGKVIINLGPGDRI